MSKLQRLHDNIEAIRHALNSCSEYDGEVLRKFTGFGGLNFVLNPLDKSQWNKSDLDCYEDTCRMHQMLREELSEQDYQRMVQSIKASVMTAYYTPRELVQAVMETIYNVPTPNGSVFGGDIRLTPKTMLDPAAGMGVFASMAKKVALEYNHLYLRATCFEKDILTAMMLKASLGGETGKFKTFVYCDGFENFPKDELGLYDMVATNVPFGNISVFDDGYTNSGSEVRRDAAKMIHRYYVLKGLDCLRDGGLLVYIITSNYLNRDGEQVMEALRQSRLIGAYRLANNLFKESGTEVGTDLLVLQKDAHKEGLTADETMLLTMYEDQGCPTNMYFTAYPERVIATSTERGTDGYGKPGFVYRHEGGVSGIAADVRERLAADLRANLAAQPQGTEPTPDGGKRRNAGGSSAKGATEPVALPKKPATKKPTKKMQAIVNIGAVYNALYDYEQKEQKENAELRKQLNQLYDAFLAEYGPLNYAPNRASVKAVSIDLLALEYRSEENGMWTKADIMLRPVAFSTEERTEPLTAQEALAESLNETGGVDVERMSRLTGKDADSLLSELAGEVFYNPLNDRYEIKARFISGDVISKADAIRKALGGETTEHRTQAEASLAALEAARPKPIPFEDLDFNLGERWIDCGLYSRFASEFFSMPDDPDCSWCSGSVMVTVKYDANIDQYGVGVDGRNMKIYSEYSVSSEASQSLDGMDLLVHALQNTCPKMMKYRRDANGRKIELPSGKGYEKDEDPEKTQQANTLIEQIRQGWTDWLMQQPREERDHLADVYNRRFNCFVKPVYDGSHQTFPGVDWQGLQDKYGIPVPTADGKGGLYQSQKDCIWMLLLNGGGICDHEVGSGKTLIMCICAHEMKRLGMCHKPMIIGLKANVGAIAETYRTAYPQARVLFATEADYSARERVDFFNRMKNNDYDCIIMSHEQFGKIPQSDEVQMELLAQELQEIEDALDAMGYGDRATTRIRKGLETRKRNLEAKRLNLQNTIRKRTDQVVDFQMMGIDHIFIDESHQFKNLGFTTRHDRVAGLGNTEGSNRAYNLLMAIRTIQKRTGRDLGATFLSGTTVTNSLTELYSLFRYLRPQALRRQGITCFDAWAAIFTKKSQEYEFNITNQIVLKERFRYFIKVPELGMFYNEITDFRTAEDVGIERPKKHTMLLNIKPTRDQRAFIKVLMKFAETGDFSLIGKADATDKQKMAKMLYATDMARKMSLDMRLIDTTYGDDPDSKSSRCAALVKRYYDLYDEQRGTQMIFSDLSTWQGKDKGWNVYKDIKDKLVRDYGIPASEVRFIQECKSDKAKQQMIADTNAGRIRVLFGSTTQLGTGVNAQQRVVAIHHLDTPWRPSDLEQRDGRGIRKGNEVARLYAGNQVDVIIYAVEQSLDSYKFNLLHLKQTFINQLKRGSLGVRTLDEGAMDEKSGMNFAEYMAILSGNTDLLERAKMGKKIAALEGERKNFLRQQDEQQQQRDALTASIRSLTESIDTARHDQQRFLTSAVIGSDGMVLNDLHIDGSVSDGFAIGSEDYLKAQGERLLQLDQTARTQGVYLPIGTVCGFPVTVCTKESIFRDLDGNEQVVYDNQFHVSGERLRYQHNNAHLNRTSPRLSATFPLLALQRLPQIISQWEADVENSRAAIAQLDTILQRTWGKETELAKLKADLAALDRKISSEIGGGSSNDNAAQGKGKPLAKAA